MISAWQTLAESFSSDSNEIKGNQVQGRLDLGGF